MSNEGKERRRKNGKWKSGGPGGAPVGPARETSLLMTQDEAPDPADETQFGPVSELAKASLGPAERVSSLPENNHCHCERIVDALFYSDIAGGSHVLFALIWAVFAVLFAALAGRAHCESLRRFPRFEYRIPSSHNMQIGNVRFQDVINKFADRFDQHVDSMNGTSHSSARWAFWANLISCLLAVCGLIAEMSSW